MYVWVTTDNLTPNQPAALTVVRVGVGNYTLLMGSQQSPPQTNQVKGAGAPDSRFAFVGAPLCGVPLDVLG